MVIHSARPQAAGTTQNNPLKTNDPKTQTPPRTRRGTPEIDTEEINELGVFFPDANIVALRQIEGFHRKLTGILDRQLDEQQARYNEIADVLDGQINQVRTQMAAISISSNLNDQELADAGRYNATIQRLTAQIDAFEKAQAAKIEVKVAAEELANRRPALLGEMTGKLNQALADGNKAIYGDSQNPPEFKLKEGSQGNQTYQFGTPRDKGDGTKAKNLILFDLSVLQLTSLSKRSCYCTWRVSGTESRCSLPSTSTCCTPLQPKRRLKATRFSSLARAQHHCTGGHGTRWTKGARNEAQLQQALETVDRQRDEQDPAPDHGKDLAIDHGEARARRQRTD